MGIPQSAFLNTFNIVIQLAPIFSVMLIFKERLIASIELWKRLIVAFIPTGVAGLLLADTIDALFSADLTIFWMIITGLLFILIEWRFNEQEHHISELERASYKQVIGIGIFQIFALVPGISRSGSTILGAMLLGFKREAAMTFSFLLAIPTMGAASGYTLLKEYHTLDFTQLELLALGFIVSFIIGWIAVKLLLKIVARYSFIPFGVYLILSALFFMLIS